MLQFQLCVWGFGLSLWKSQWATYVLAHWLDLSIGRHLITRWPNIGLYFDIRPSNHSKEVPLNSPLSSNRTYTSSSFLWCVPVLGVGLGNYQPDQLAGLWYCIVATVPIRIDELQVLESI